MFSVPPAVVFKVVQVMAPSAVSVLLELLNVRVVYVPAGTYCAPVVRANWTVPVQVFPVGIAGSVVHDVTSVPPLVGVNAPVS